MVGGTRSGRVTKARSEQPSPATGKPKAKTPGATAKPKPKPAKRRNENSTPKAVRSKGKKATAAVTEEKSEQSDVPVPAAASQETKAKPEAAPEEVKPPLAAPLPKPKVTRIYNEIWGSTLDSIAFVSESGLSRDDDTNTIALNLIDHIIKPENWNPDLSYNVLSATCFFFASKITGLNRNTVDKIASAMKVDPHLVEVMTGPQVHHNPVVKARLAEALRVGPEDVKNGYGILFAQKEGLKEFVGEYAEKVDALPNPDDLGKMEVQKVTSNMGWKRGEGLGGEKKGIASPIKAADRPFPEVGLGWLPERFKPDPEDDGEEEEKAEASIAAIPSDEAATEAEKASEVELDPSELDDFDRFVEENE